MSDELTSRTKLWQRSQNSFATTIPKFILAARGVPVDEEVEVEWRIDSDTYNVVVEFHRAEKEDDD